MKRTSTANVVFLKNAVNELLVESGRATFKKDEVSCALSMLIARSQ